MSLILSIETSTAVCSVAIHQNGVPLSVIESYETRSHSKVILSQIQAVLKQASLPFSELKAIAVSKGPGSFTGLRIGTSISKGLCYGLDLPLIGVNTLEALAIGANNFNYKKSLLCPMVDARRLEVYCSFFNSSLEVILPTKAVIIDQNTFNEILIEKEVLFFGDGSNKCKSILGHYDNAVFIENVVPSAKYLGGIANKLFNESKFEDVTLFEPYYLKDFMEITVK